MNTNSKYKKGVSMMMVIYIKQHLRNICCSIHEKVKQHWGWVEKSAAYKEEACNWFISFANFERIPFEIAWKVDIISKNYSNSVKLA